MENEQNSQRVVVEIFGERHVLRGTQPEAQIRKLAEEIDQRMRDIARKFSFLGVHQIAILTSLHVADEKLQMQHDLMILRQENIDLLEESERANSGQRQLTKEIALLRQEQETLLREMSELGFEKTDLLQENKTLREEKITWTQEKELMAEEIALLSREKLRLRLEIEELSSLLETATTSE